MENKRPTYKYPLLLLIGPSGSGKDTIMQLIKKKMDIAFSPTFTTRDKRPNEKPGVYNFVSMQEFQKLIEQDAFIEYDSHFGNYYGSNKYSILELLEHKPVMKQTEINGVKKIKNNSSLQYNAKEHTINIKSNKVKLYFLGILMESVEHTKEAILKRDGDIPAARKRIARMQEEYEFIKENADYCIINYYNKQEQCADEFVKLIKKLINNN